MAQLGNDSGSQSQDTASWDFGSAISVFVLSKPRLRTGRVVELWCEEPDRALADTALVKESPNNTGRRTPDWHSQRRAGRCSHALGMFAVPAQGQQRCSCTDDGFKPAARAVCSTSTLGGCFTQRWMLEMQRSCCCCVYSTRPADPPRWFSIEFSPEKLAEVRSHAPYKKKQAQ